MEKYKEVNSKIKNEILIKEDIISKQNEEKKSLSNRVKYLENFINNLIVKSQIKQKMDFKIREIKKKSQQMVQKKDKKRKFCLMF